MTVVEGITLGEVYILDGKAKVTPISAGLDGFGRYLFRVIDQETGKPRRARPTHDRLRPFDDRPDERTLLLAVARAADAWLESEASDKTNEVVALIHARDALPPGLLKAYRPVRPS